MSATVSRKLRVGFLLNPVAGAGGAEALKGSDAAATREAVFRGEYFSPVIERVKIFFQSLSAVQDKLEIHCVEGLMGSAALSGSPISLQLLDCKVKDRSDAEDTKIVCAALYTRGIDILVFAGGDGTARDVFDVVGTRCLCLGIPAGVKMQSAVFGVHPHACAELLQALIKGTAVNVDLREVRDLDEFALLTGKVKSQHYGEMKVPVLNDLVQNVKQGGAEIDELLIIDMAEELKERISHLNNPLLIFGPGSTTQRVQKELGYAETLLGVDVFIKERFQLDVTEKQLFELLEAHSGEVRLVLTVIGGQGHLIGRGNQQLSARVLELIGRENIWIVAAPHKLEQLAGSALIIDSGSRKLNEDWCGLVEIITGYQSVALHYLK